MNAPISEESADMPIRDAVVMQWERWAQTRHVSPDILRWKFDAVADQMFGGMVVRLTRDLLTHKLASTEHEATITVPATWWDHWKQERGRVWLGPWWVRRWPPRLVERTATIRIEHAYVYPEAVMDHQLGRPFMLDTTYGPYWKDGGLS